MRRVVNHPLSTGLGGRIIAWGGGVSRFERGTAEGRRSEIAGTSVDFIVGRHGAVHLGRIRRFASTGCMSTFRGDEAR
jgi:hypothetical protein